jgi:hypothetical protein
MEAFQFQMHTKFKRKSMIFSTLVRIRFDWLSYLAYKGTPNPSVDDRFHIIFPNLTKKFYFNVIFNIKYLPAMGRRDSEKLSSANRN